MKKVTKPSRIFFNRKYQMVFFKRTVCIKTILFLFLIAVVHCLPAQDTNNKKPNIIFILTDDQRFDALGYYGNELARTPEMDKLAEEGTYFRNAMVTTPICAASRASILTGLYERSHNYNFQTGDIREDYMDESYPKLLKDAGYHTGFFGKYGVNFRKLEDQFSVFESYDRGAYEDRRGYYYKTIDKDTVHLTRYTGQKAIDFIDDAPAEKPFCLSLSFSAPHAHDRAEEQYFWQDETSTWLRDKKVPGPSLGTDKYFNDLPKAVREGYNRTRWFWRYDTPEKYQHSVKGYFRMIAGIDMEITKIRAKLKEKGLEKETVIILMGDNGYFLGERQLAGKWLMYDNSVRVPLIVYDPRGNKHTDIDEMALNIDVPATIVDLAGVPQPKSWHGKSLMPLVEQKERSMGRDTVLLEHIWEVKPIPPSEGVRTKDWKYFRYVNDKSIEELYHLKSDPQETTNLAQESQYAKVLSKLRLKCDALIEQYSDKFRNPPYDLNVKLIGDTNGDEEFTYSWILPKESVSQTAYQILVASTKNNMDNNVGDVWDSQRVKTPKKKNIKHHGKMLEAGKTYWWKVRIWDNANRLTDYSRAQSFSIETTK